MARIANQLLAQFEEDTAYERFALDTIGTAGQPPNPTPPPRDDLRGGGLFMTRSASDWLAADSVALAVGNFRPLGFGAAYKVLEAVPVVVGERELRARVRALTSDKDARSLGRRLQRCLLPSRTFGFSNQKNPSKGG